MVNLQLTIKVEKPVHMTHYLLFDKDGSLPKNVTKGEFESLCKLKNESNLAIQRQAKVTPKSFSVNILIEIS